MTEHLKLSGYAFFRFAFICVNPRLISKLTPQPSLLSLEVFLAAKLIWRMDQVKKAPPGNRARVKRPNAVTGCPLTAALAALGGKWKMIIVYWLAESPKHFAALRREMSSISQKVLTQQLRELIDDGIVKREPQGSPPAPVEYSLTDYGQSVLPLVENVRLWGREHLEHLASDNNGD